ncbi:hypothetical protein [Bifidobacterium callimiconis]|uniref:Uncharacterized protein n=1 Tax=Bifidobacterium callimiconis TaxID=2306973 RepID=A0A430FF33_9BIFI|nr:hypothetical protein [Bifidobacterium callimiconis]RSX51446.1 hypothetical protein D2E23_0709 [Bifidobacterium callimiconis]
MEPTAVPITEPAMPIFAENRKDVTAASAPAMTGTVDMFLKNFLNNGPLYMDFSCDVFRYQGSA